MLEDEIYFGAEAIQIAVTIMHTNQRIQSPGVSRFSIKTSRESLVPDVTDVQNLIAEAVAEIKN
jgi:hypothetical protein